MTGGLLVVVSLFCHVFDPAQADIVCLTAILPLFTATLCLDNRFFCFFVAGGKNFHPAESAAGVFDLVVFTVQTACLHKISPVFRGTFLHRRDAENLSSAGPCLRASVLFFVDLFAP